MGGHDQRRKLSRASASGGIKVRRFGVQQLGKGTFRLTHPAGRNRKIGKPIRRQAHRARASGRDRSSRKALWPAVTCAAPTGRTHGRTDQPCRSQKSLAKGEPSTHGADQTLSVAPMEFRVPTKTADARYHAARSRQKAAPVFFRRRKNLPVPPPRGGAFDPPRASWSSEGVGTKGVPQIIRRPAARRTKGTVKTKNRLWPPCALAGSPPSLLRGKRPGKASKRKAYVTGRLRRHAMPSNVSRIPKKTQLIS